MPKLPGAAVLAAVLAAVPLAALPAAFSSAAYAHAQLRGADPPVGGTVSRAPAEVALLFSEAVEPRFCTVRVESADGAQVDKGDLHVMPDDPRRLAVGLGPLPAGEYRVVWRAISVDTHRTQGRFSFTVAP